MSKVSTASKRTRTNKSGRDSGQNTPENNSHNHHSRQNQSNRFKKTFTHTLSLQINTPLYLRSSLNIQGNGFSSEYASTNNTLGLTTPPNNNPLTETFAEYKQHLQMPADLLQLLAKEIATSDTDNEDELDQAPTTNNVEAINNDDIESDANTELGDSDNTDLENPELEDPNLEDDRSDVDTESDIEADLEGQSPEQNIAESNNAEHENIIEMEPIEIIVDLDALNETELEDSEESDDSETLADQNAVAENDEIESQPNIQDPADALEESIDGKLDDNVEGNVEPESETPIDADNLLEELDEEENLDQELEAEVGEDDATLDSDNQPESDPELSLDVDEEESFSPVDTSSIPASTTPPLTSASVSMGPVRAAIEQRAGGMPNGQITAGTEATRRAERMREQAAEAQEGNAEAITESAENGLPPLPADLPAGLLSQDNPAPGTAELLAEASNRTLDNQTPPRLIRTPQGNLPVLGYSPISPDQLRRLRSVEFEQPEGQEETDAHTRLMQMQERLMTKPEVREGEGVIPALVDVPPPEHPVIPEGNKAQLSQALARILENPAGEARRMMGRARGSAFVGDVLNNIDATSSIGNDTMATEFAEVLGTQLDEIRDEAGISAESVDEEVRKRREDLDAQRAAEEESLQMCITDERRELQEANQNVANAVAGGRSAMDERAEDIQASAGGENRRAAIEGRRDRLIADVTRYVAQEDANYRRAGETRASDLQTNETQQIAAYRFAVQQDEFQLNRNRDQNAPRYLRRYTQEQLTSFSNRGIDPVQFRIQELVAESNEWLERRLRTVRREFTTLKTAAETWTTTNKNDIQDAGESAREQIREWATTTLGDETSWWDEIVAMIDDWFGQAEANNEAWETVQNQETAVVASGYVSMINQVERAAAAGITEEQMLARSDLSAEERAIIHHYFNPPPGTVGRDPIGAVAFGIRERIYQQRAGELKGRIEAKVLDGSYGASGRAHVSVLEQIGQAYTSGFNAWNRASQLHAAFYPGITGLGTEEEEVYAALANLNPVQAMAVRMAYQQDYGESLESALNSEMDTDGESNRATALLEGDQAVADAAALHMAMEETYLGTGFGTDRDLIMNTLRNKTPEEITAIREAYARDYPGDNTLDQLLQEELNDWATMSSHDADMAAAYMDSNTDLADAIGMDQALHGFTWGYAFNLAYGTEFEEGGRDEFTAVTDRIRQEVAQQAAANQWDDAQFQAELLRRMQRVENVYDDNYFAHGGLRGAIDDRFQEGPNRDLLNATLDNDEIRVDAARVAAERYGSIIYASDDVMIETVERRYDRALEATRRDMGPRLQQQMETQLNREDREFFERHHRYMTGAERFARQQEIEVENEAEMEEEARRRSMRDTQRMDDVFREEYGDAHGETLREAIDESTSGVSGEHALTALDQGGYLSRYQRFDFAVRGGGTREEAAQRAIAGATPAELEEMDRRWRREHPGETLRGRALSELSGKDAMDMEVNLEGRAMTVDDALRIERLRVSLEQPTNWFGEQIAGPERSILDFRMQQMEENARRLREPVLTDEDRQRRDRILNDFAFNQEAVQAAVQQHRARVSAITDAIANTASMVVAVAVGALITFFSGGSAGPLAIALIASLAATMTSVGTRMALMGNQYGQEELMTDIGIGIVDAIVAAATAGIGNRLLGISQIARAAGGSAVKTGLRGAVQNVQRRLAAMLARLPNIGPVAQRTNASRMLQNMASGPWYKRLAAHGIAEGVENAVGAFPTAVVSTVIDDRNWEGGFQFGNAFSSIAQQVGMGVGMGVAMSGGMAGAGRLLSGARGLISGPRLGADVHFTSPDHLPTNDGQYRSALDSYLGGKNPDGSPRTQADFDFALQRERQRHLDDFLRSNPGKTESDFNARLQSEASARRAEFEEMHRGREDMDFDVEAGREAGEQVGKVDQQHKERQQFADELSDAAPDGRGKDLADVPVSVLSDVEFARATGKLSGDSAVIVRDGQAHVVVRQGADPASIRQQAAHLADITAPGTAGRVNNPAEALPSDLKGRVNVDVNPDLPARSVQVHYESHNGVIIGVWVEVGPGARAVDIQMHANTVRSMRRLQGISGRIRNLINRMRRWANLNPAPPPGTRAFEARLEMEKLPDIIAERANALRNATSPEEQIRLMAEVENLRAQMEHHSRFVNAVEAEPGVGYVAADDLKPNQIKYQITKNIEDPQARSILSGMLDNNDDVLGQLLHYRDLINNLTTGLSSPQQVTKSLSALVDTVRSLRDVTDGMADQTVIPRIMNKALNAEDPAAFLARTKQLADDLPTAEGQQIIRDIGYMTDVDGPNGRVEDFVSAATRLMDSDLPPDARGAFLQSAVGATDRVRLLDGVSQLSTLTDDPAVLRAVAERLNGTSSRSAMSPSNRADFIDGMNSLINKLDQLGDDLPQYKGLAPDLLMGATDAHLSGSYFDSVDDLIKTLREYEGSDNATVVGNIRNHLETAKADPEIASIIDAASAPVGTTSAAGESSIGKIMDAMGEADAERELGAIARSLDELTTRSIVDPDLGTRARPAVDEITKALGDIDIDTLPPHLQAHMRQIMDKVREFNRSVGDGSSIIPGDRRISDELYADLRKKTPSQTIRDQVNTDASGNPIVPPYNDPALPGMTVTGTLHADHIVSMDTITTIEGFERLTTDQKIAILNDPRNFIGLSEAANTSKGPKSFKDWEEHQASGTRVDPTFRAEMMAREIEVKAQLEARIREMVAANEAAASGAAPPPASSPPTAPPPSSTTGS